MRHLYLYTREPVFFYGRASGPPEVEQEVLADEDLKKSSGWPNHRGEVLEGNRRGQCQRLPTQDKKGEVTKRGLRATEKLLRPTKIEEVPFRWQGCINCAILPSGMGAHGVSSEHVENMEMFSCSPT